MAGKHAKVLEVGNSERDRPNQAAHDAAKADDRDDLKDQCERASGHVHVREYVSGNSDGEED